MTPLIRCEDAAFAYGRRLAVGGLCFVVEPGDYLCVVGENGSGKSTLIKGLLGLHPAAQGSIEYGGGMRAGGIGYLPQQSPAQRVFPAGVWEIVLSGRLGRRGLRPFYTAGDKQAAREQMRRLDIGDLAKRSYRELSGGQQQRVLLARALCAADSLLLLDEPVSGLDPAAAGEMYALIRQINRESGVAVVMVSHDLPAVLQDAKHVLHLRGRQEFFGTAEAYRTFQGGFWGEGYHV